MLLLLFSILVLASCGNDSKSEKENADEELAFLDVAVMINPEQAKMNEPVQFQAKVTYGEKPVKKADEVKFEIWRSQSEKHEKIDVKHTKDGIYELEKSFSEEGTYYIYAHVTAEGMHSMPKKKFVVGKPSAEEE